MPSEIESFEAMLSTIKSLVLALPSRVADRVAAADAHSAEQIVSSEVEELLAEVDTQ